MSNLLYCFFIGWWSGALVILPFWTVRKFHKAVLVGSM